MSITKGTAILVYSSNKSTLVNTFSSARKAAEFFNSAHNTIFKFANNGKLFKDKWFLCFSVTKL
jgi:hypothetical protein